MMSSKSGAVESPSTYLVPLHETVFLGYTDIAGAGSRALLAMSGNKEDLMFEVPELPNAIPSCQHVASKSKTDSKSKRKALYPFMVYNCKNKQYSLLIINTHVPARTSHAVAKYVVNACSNSFVHKIFFMSALRLDISEGPIQRMYENTFNGMCPGTNCKSLSSDLKFSDPLLSNLVQMFLIEGMPFSVLACPAHKAESGYSSEVDGSSEVIETMQEYLNEMTHIGFSLKESCALNFDNRGQNPDMVSMIYV